VERDVKVNKRDSDDRAGREDKGDWAWVGAMKRPSMFLEGWRVLRHNGGSAMAVLDDYIPLNYQPLRKGTERAYRGSREYEHSSCVSSQKKQGSFPSHYMKKI
jgi:hypothetical protein